MRQGHSSIWLFIGLAVVRLGLGIRTMTIYERVSLCVGSNERYSRKPTVSIPHCVPLGTNTLPTSPSVTTSGSSGSHVSSVAYLGM